MVGIHERTGRERISSSKVREAAREGTEGKGEGGEEGKGEADFRALYLDFYYARTMVSFFQFNESILPSLLPSLPPFPIPVVGGPHHEQ